MIQFLIVLILIFHPHEALARTWTASREKTAWERSLRYYNQSDFVKAKNLLLILVKQNPSKPLYWFNLGNAYFMMGDHGRSITAYLKVEELGSTLAPAATLYRAKALTARGEADAARLVLRSLVARPNLPPAIAEEASRNLMSDSAASDATTEALSYYRAGRFARALRVLNKIKNPDENQQLLKALTLIKLDREDRAHDILKNLEANPEMRGLVGTLLDRIRDGYSKPYWLFVEGAGGFDSGFIAFGDAGGGIRLWTENLWYFNSGYAIRLRETPADPEDRTLSHEIRGNLGRELGSDLFLVSPFYVQESWDGTAARSIVGAAVKARAGQPRMEWSAEAEFSQDSALNQDYDYVEGMRQRYAVSFSRLVSSSFLRVQLFYERADIGDQNLGSGLILPAAYRGWGPTLKLLWRLHNGFVAEASALYMYRYYPTTTSPNSLRRLDQQWTIGARVARVFSNRLSAYVSWTQDKNTSTLDASTVNNENFNRTQVLAGVIWDVL